MAATTPNLGLTIWNDPTDHFNYQALYENFNKIDLHDHTGGANSGVQIGAGALAGNSVTASAIASDAVTTAKILDGNVTNSKLASDAVTTAKILDGNITTAKILDANVTADKLASNSVVTAKISNANVTNAKLATGIIPELSTSLPTTGLFNGYTVDYTNSISYPTYVWRFRYDDTISGTYKWVFVGGSHSSSYSTSSSLNITSTTYVTGSPAQSLTLPLAGIYQIRFGVRAAHDANNGTAFMGLTAATTLPSQTLISGDGSMGTAEITLELLNAGYHQIASRQIRYTASASNTVLTAQYKITTAGTGTFNDRWISVQPIAVI